MVATSVQKLANNSVAVVLKRFEACFVAPPHGQVHMQINSHRHVAVLIDLIVSCHQSSSRFLKYAVHSAYPVFESPLLPDMTPDRVKAMQSLRI